jgi:aspartate carbamoyltransferase catalytic subunit
MIFCAPDSLQIGADILAELDRAGVPHERTADFDDAVARADAVYMTRIQDEWDTAQESRALDTTPFHFQARHLRLLGPESIVMHPLPRRAEIAVEVDGDPRAMYWRQVRNGMWVRVALILSLFERDGEVDRYYADLTG